MPVQGRPGAKTAAADRAGWWLPGPAAGVLVCLLALPWLGGCAGAQTTPSWGARWPDGADLREAALGAATAPQTWAPLVGAAVISIGDVDEDLSDWAADEQPLFGSDAGAWSDDLRSASRAAWLLSALTARSEALTAKAGGVLVGLGTFAVEDVLTDTVKDASGRERPDGSDDRSFSSGHAATAATATTLARRNLRHRDLPGWLDVSLDVGLYGLAAGTAWARVEARKHHVSDVLAGYALGHFVAAFMDEAFMRSPLAGARVTYQGMGRGGALTITLPAGR